MELLMDTALCGDNESEFAKNIYAKAEVIQKMADEKIEEAIKQAEENMENIDIPDEAWEHISDDAKEHMPGKEGKLDIRKIMSQKSDAIPDPDVEKFKNKLETILPGITAGDPKKLDMKDFSFNKVDDIFDAVDEFTEKKNKDAKDIAKKEIEKAKDQVKGQIKSIDEQIGKAKAASPFGSSGASDEIKALEDSKMKINESLKAFDDIDLDGTSKAKVPLPRIDIEKIREQTDQITPQMMEAMQHVQSMKAMGIEDENTKDLEKQIQDMMEISTKQIEQGLKEAETSFKESYIMAAHFMGEGLSPHKKSLDEVKKSFLEAVANKEDVSGKDFSCIDLSGENLDGIDLSGAFLEQVNFKGASLKGADFFQAILARANFDDADLTEANFNEANVGAVHAHNANFTKAKLKSAKLSKGDFTRANFSKADLEDIEALEIVIDEADFTQAHMPKVNFLEIKISGAKFIKADISTSAFIKCSIENTDFTGAVMNRCAFVDTNLSSVCFDSADLSNACFVATKPEKSTMKNLTFRGACLKQANFQNMDMKKTILSDANLENAFFGGTDLFGADLSRAYAKNAQFRKAKLTKAKLDDINLMEASLAKAHLTGASFKRANLYQADFLRSTITDTDFSGSNLDYTLIEHWRPK
ncbi:MAG: hypothetical protein GWP10_20625 [Nitrospiraceae bacterium]|nr:hypothetical protein [Nitrospiraceae bacterium]